MVTEDGAQGRTWRCAECGGAVPLRSLAGEPAPCPQGGVVSGGEPRCPFCGAAQPLDSGLRAELERYRAQVEQLEARADRELDEVARMRVYRDDHGEVVAGIAGRGRQALFCPNCGAKNDIEVGQLVIHCSHCEGPLLPAGTTVQDGIDQTRARWRDAQLHRIREERRSTLWRQGHDYFAGGRWCLLFFAGASLLALALAAVTGNLRGNPVLLVVLVVLAAALLLLSAPVIARFRRCRGGRRQELQPLLARHGGGPLETFAAVRRWLDARWDSYYHPFFLARSAGTDYAELTFDGVPVLVNVHLRQHDLLDTERLHLLLSSPLPQLRDEAPRSIRWTDPAREAGAQLAELGFSAEVWEAGVLVQASDETVQRLARDGVDAGLLERALVQGLGLARSLRDCPD